MTEYDGNQELMRVVYEVDAPSAQPTDEPGEDLREVAVGAV